MPASLRQATKSPTQSPTQSPAQSLFPPAHFPHLLNARLGKGSLLVSVRPEDGHAFKAHRCGVAGVDGDRFRTRLLHHLGVLHRLLVGVQRSDPDRDPDVVRVATVASPTACPSGGGGGDGELRDARVEIGR